MPQNEQTHATWYAESYPVYDDCATRNVTRYGIDPVEAREHKEATYRAWNAALSQPVAYAVKLNRELRRTITEMETELIDTKRALELLLKRNGAVNVTPIVEQWIQEARFERKGER